MDDSTRPAFKDWLADVLVGTGVSRRELARRLAEKHPEGVTDKTLDSQRKTVRRILSGDSNPTQPTREAICDALGVPRDECPSADDEAADSQITRDEFSVWKRVNRKLEMKVA